MAYTMLEVYVIPYKTKIPTLTNPQRWIQVLLLKPDDSFVSECLFSHSFRTNNVQFPIKNFCC